ncbi:efflux RND transporter periplasmic adaptor subunit [Halothiobacillus neapolitanus]|uniref:Efflux transporter, RND family, MFP subunit n=1 Tax=Halothiobacillus neapolitanus (strain ATCC 23641 / DSM 15147 / CIP 104769 / NCIMB 8539 / c2) TaxID=555778 RepID=D0KYY9_HALNC|nr:efflux RND transporter periplasmic adaptor subunit [Halothiobacillus neapolitanus]ACX95662.1 efflux transporter, RND family, MFP subunit [Halothiobacillus neapolitanus c2]TDN65966.1 RND family efflux transporter MFP subunit [Halothiobacillus neapolitanus]
MIELKHTQPAGGLPLRNGLTSPGSVMTSGLVLVLAMAITGCQKQSAEVELPPPVVRVATIAPGTLAQPDLTGVIVAKTQSAVGFQVSGRIAERVVKRGAGVKAGEVLATLDDADFKAKQAAALAQAQQAQAEARFAQQNFTRVQSLLAKKLASQQEYDQAKSNLQAAKANEQASQAQLEQARLALGYTALKAPFASVVAAIDADQGAVVNAGQPVVTLAAGDARQALVAVPEQRLMRLPNTAQARVHGQSTAIEATFASNEGEVDPASRTWSVRFNLAANPSVKTGLGQSITLSFPKQTVPKSVPITAILGQGSQAAVFEVRQNGTVKMQPVTVTRLEHESAVISTDLASGTRIVALGVNRLHDGQRVRIQPGLGTDTAPNTEDTP